jgi:hypothetical protein
MTMSPIAAVMAATAKGTPPRPPMKLSRLSVDQHVDEERAGVDQPLEQLEHLKGLKNSCIK